MRCSMRASGRRWYSAPPRWPCTSRHCEHPPQRRPEDAVLRGVDGVVVVADLERDHQDGSARRLIADANPSADGPGGLVDRAITLHHAVQQGALAEPGERLGERGPQIGVRLGFDVVMAHTEESRVGSVSEHEQESDQPDSFRGDLDLEILDPHGPDSIADQEQPSAIVRGADLDDSCASECGRDRRVKSNADVSPRNPGPSTAQAADSISGLPPCTRGIVSIIYVALFIADQRSSAPVNKHRPPVDRRRWRPASSTNSCGSGCSASRTP